MFIKTISNETKTLSKFLPNEILLIIDKCVRSSLFKERQKPLEKLVNYYYYMYIVRKHCDYNILTLSHYYKIKLTQNNRLLEVTGRHDYNEEGERIYVRREIEFMTPGLQIVQNRLHFKDVSLIESSLTIYNIN